MQQLLQKIGLIVLFYVLDYMRSWCVENEKPIPSDNDINGCYTNQVTYARELLYWACFHHQERELRFLKACNEL